MEGPRHPAVPRPQASVVRPAASSRSGARGSAIGLGRAWRRLRRTLLVGVGRSRPVDWLTLGYLILSGALLSWLDPSHWRDLATHLVFAAFALYAIAQSSLKPGSRGWLIVRTAYPVFLMTHGFLIAARLQSALNESHWLTRPLVLLDRAWFGVHPTLFFEQVQTRWLTELLAFFYLAYYALPLLVLVPLWAARHRRQAIEVAGMAMLTYVVTYSMYWGLPAVNPKMSVELGALHEGLQPGYLFSAWERAIQGDHGAVVGNSFPSAHVSGAVSWSLLAWRYVPHLAWLAATLTVGTSVSTVYLGVHHGLDPIAGAIVAAGCHAIGSRWIGHTSFFSRAPCYGRTISYPLRQRR